MAATTTITLVAEANVGGRRKARCARSIDACRWAVVYLALASADVIHSFSTVRHGGGPKLTRSEWVGVDGFAVEGELGVGVRQPVVHLGGSDQVRSRLYNFCQHG